MNQPARTGIEIGLTAAIVSVDGEEPQILVASGNENEPRAGLPSGPFDPLEHHTFEIGLRSWVMAQTALSAGYVEQLYTFGDRGRAANLSDKQPHVVSIGYLALTHMPENVSALRAAGAGFEPWYRFFPWEDWRNGRPPIIDDAILPLLTEWAASGTRKEAARALSRQQRLQFAFSAGGSPWDEEKTLDRYELLYEAGLVEEALRDGREAAHARKKQPALGETMRFDHRRILATAIARLRSKLKYRPVIFELMNPQFTLTSLQNTVEAISGRHLHQQNFRRRVEAGGCHIANSDICGDGPAPSWASNQRLASSPPPNPVSAPVAPITRWQGSTMGSGLAPLAAPTARLAAGRPTRRASSP